MDEVDRRGWAVPSAQGRLGGIDVALLAPADEDDRRLRILAEPPELPQAIDRDVDEVGIGGKPVARAGACRCTRSSPSALG